MAKLVLLGVAASLLLLQLDVDAMSISCFKFCNLVQCAPNQVLRLDDCNCPYCQQGVLNATATATATATVTTTTPTPLFHLLESNQPGGNYTSGLFEGQSALPAQPAARRQSDEDQQLMEVLLMAAIVRKMQERQMHQAYQQQAYTARPPTNTTIRYIHNLKINILFNDSDVVDTLEKYPWLKSVDLL